MLLNLVHYTTLYAYFLIGKVTDYSGAITGKVIVICVYQTCTGKAQHYLQYHVIQ